MGDVLFLGHPRKLWELCDRVGVTRNLRQRNVQVAYARFTDDRTGHVATVKLNNKSLALLFFFQEKVPKDKRFNPSTASYIDITPAMRTELLAFMADVRMLQEEERIKRLPTVVESATRAELFWKEKPPRVRRL